MEEINVLVRFLAGSLLIQTASPSQLGNGRYIYSCQTVSETLLRSALSHPWDFVLAGLLARLPMYWLLIEWNETISSKYQPVWLSSKPSYLFDICFSCEFFQMNQTQKKKGSLIFLPSSHFHRKTQQQSTRPPGTVSKTQVNTNIIPQ